jgi:preprotein translocase subunit SecY
MWLAEKINDHGIGNGISIILFANIVSRGPTLLKNVIMSLQLSKAYDYENGSTALTGGIVYVIFMSLFVLFLIWFIIHISDSERRIPIQYAKKVVGRKMYGGQSTNLPIKLNMAGVMPVIFASSILSIPQIISMFVKPEQGTFWYGFFNQFTGVAITNTILTLILILVFAYFYVSISFNPVEVAGNLQKNGGSIPGIRPGRATSDFIKRVLSKITFIGALALAVIAVLPMVIQLIINIFSPAYSAEALVNTNYMIQLFESWGVENATEIIDLPIGFAQEASAIASGAQLTPIWYIGDFVQSGTSIIIVVGVILETLRELETQMSMRHYKGFLE